MSKCLKAPFSYFGGKATVASRVWKALGNVNHYLEPFCGSCAVLLARPHWNPQQHVETVVDKDGHIANVWRSLQANPDEVAKWCDWPVNHADLIARKRKLNLNTETLLERLCADDEYYDPKLAGYYIWAASCWIGAGLICPGQRPNLANAGKGVHAKGQRPNLANAGKGVHAKGQRPNLANAGKGVHAKGSIPNLARGEGVHAKGSIPNLARGEGVQEPYKTPIYDWFRELSERLRNVRVVCGDWSRVCGGDWQHKSGIPVGIFFDPPYSDVADRTAGIYAEDSLQVAHDVQQWCLKRGNRKKYRIVLAGYYDEHKELLQYGWRAHHWKSGGGYGNTSGAKQTRGKTNRHKECLFLSPHCVGSKGLLI